MDQDKDVPIRALSRGIAVLRAINRGSSLSMMEIARSSQVPYPTACRIVQTLIHEGLVECEPARKRYRPTAMVQALAHGFQGDAKLVHVSRPHLVDLTRRFGWPISLSTCVGDSMVIRDSTHALTSLTFSHYFPGFTIPILESAAGLVHLAHLPMAEREAMLDRLTLLPKRINPSFLDLVRNSDLLADVRRNGFATRDYNQFTHNPGKTSSIAVPVAGASGALAGAVTLAFFASTTRMKDAVAQFVGPLRDAAQAIAADLDATD